MTELSSAAYVGTVSHRRLTPAVHAFAYRVFSLALDIDEIDRLSQSLRLFSRNRWNLLSFHDRDHGARDGTDVAVHIRGVLQDAGLRAAGHRIKLLCYPRIFGFVFNPLSVYFCSGADGALGAIVYEVSNTFGERRSYVIPASARQGEIVRQQCDKEMDVSPFTARRGSYDFQVMPLGERVFVGVDFREPRGLVLKTSFSGRRRPVSDPGLLSLVVRHPLMIFKVIAGIHFEAARLWFKGVPVVARETSPPYSVSNVANTKRDT